MSSNCLVFHTSGGISSSPAAFLFLIFLRTESSSSCVNSPSLMSNCLLIILVIGSCVYWGDICSWHNRQYVLCNICSMQHLFMSIFVTGFIRYNIFRGQHLLLQIFNDGQYWWTAVIRDYICWWQIFGCRNIYGWKCSLLVLLGTIFVSCNIWRTILPGHWPSYQVIDLVTGSLT